MKRLAIILACFMALNIGSIAPNTPTSAVAQPAPFNLTKELKRKQAKHDLQQVVTYLTTRANKTSYVFSGSNTKGWDCSGMVRWAYRQVGIYLPHSADKQAHKGKRVNVPQRGDIVVFAYTGRTDFYHAAIYLGDGLIINANREYGTTVIEPLSNFKSSQIRYVRIVN
jgi:cell wall-associated NlpC family hydrolase